MKKQIVRFQQIACFDNQGATADRYTVVYLDQPERETNTFAALGMNSAPFHPQGIGMHTAAQPGQHLGADISFDELPEDCRSAVLNDLNATQVFAYFNRFQIGMTPEAASDCSHQGKCDDDVKAWAGKIHRTSEVTPEALRAELKEYGAWDDEELSDDSNNWERIIWLAAGNIQEDAREREREIEREQELETA